MRIGSALHLVLHVAVPAVVALLFARKQWFKPFAMMMATMLIDLDHFLSNPIYDPHRCSIGFHPLHTWPAMIVYALLSVFKATRWIGVGLVIHMILDGIDCLR